MKGLLKKIYHALPLKKEVFTIVKKVWVPPMSVFQHLYFHDTIEVDAGNEKKFKMVHYGHALENELFWKGLYNGWEKYSMRVWAQLSENAEVVIGNGPYGDLYRRTLWDIEGGFLCIRGRHQRNLGCGGPQPLVSGIRNGPTFVERGARNMQPDNLFRMGDRQLGEDYCVQQLEDAEIRANSNTQRKQRSGCESGSASKLAQRVDEITNQVFKPEHVIDVIVTGGGIKTIAGISVRLCKSLQCFTNFDRDLVQWRFY